MGEKYRLARGRVGGIAAALGLDDPRVGAAYERALRAPDRQHLRRPPGARERVRWARAGVAGRLEGLSPFWTAYALTLTETVGSTIVALPIAVAAIGPLPAVAILVAARARQRPDRRVHGRRADPQRDDPLRQRVHRARRGRAARPHAARSC